MESIFRGMYLYKLLYLVSPQIVIVVTVQLITLITQYIQGWFKQRQSYEVEVLRPLFHKLYGDAHTFVQTKLHPKMALLEAIYIRQCTDLLQGLLTTEVDPTSKIPPRNMDREFVNFCDAGTIRPY